MNNRFGADENRLEQCFAANIVQCCQQYCSVLMWAAKHCSMLFSSGQNRLFIFCCVLQIYTTSQRYIFFVFYNISPPDLVILLILTCFFLLRDEIFCSDIVLFSLGQNLAHHGNLFPVNNLSNCIFCSLWGWVDLYFTKTTTNIIVNVQNSTKEDSSSSHLQLR